MFPRSSGEYNFLRRIYHPAFGFVAGWLSATVGFAAPIALAAMAFSIYLTSSLPIGSEPAGAPASVTRGWSLLIGLAITWLAALVHLRRRAVRQRLSQRLDGCSSSLLIIVFIVAGFVVGDAQPISFAPSAADLGYIGAAPFAISLVFVMYSYSGWNAATYIVGELREPTRNLPRALFVGTAIVIVALRLPQCRLPRHDAGERIGRTA